MSYVISVENIKCGGCANTIKHKVSGMEGVESVDVAIEEGLVTIEGDEAIRDEGSAQLLHLGYPEKGTAEGIKAAAAKAKSFVSCAIGRMETPKQE